MMKETELARGGSVNRVDVLLTVYLRTQFLATAITSALQQTFRNLRIIVLDNSNCSDIRDICETFGDVRLIYSPNVVNLGAMGSLARGIKESDAEYITLLSDDDAWEPEFLATLVAALDNNPSCNVAFCDHWCMDIDGLLLVAQTDELSRKTGRTSRHDGYIQNLPQMVVEYNGVPLALTAVFRRSALPLDRLYPEIAGAYDYWIALLISSQSNLAFFTRKRLARYRIHHFSESERKAPDKLNNHIFLFKKAIELGLHPSYDTFFTELLSMTEGKAAVEHLYFGERSNALCLACAGWPRRFNKHKLAVLVLAMLPNRLPHAVIRALRNVSKKLRRQPPS